MHDVCCVTIENYYEINIKFVLFVLIVQKSERVQLASLTAERLITAVKLQIFPLYTVCLDSAMEEFTNVKPFSVCCLDLLWSLAVCRCEVLLLAVADY